MLHFFKDLPNAYLVAFMLLVFLAAYLYTRDSNLLPIIVGLIGSFGALCTQRDSKKSDVTAEIEKAEIAVTPPPEN